MNVYIMERSVDHQVWQSGGTKRVGRGGEGWCQTPSQGCQVLFLQLHRKDRDPEARLAPLSLKFFSSLLSIASVLKT